MNGKTRTIVSAAAGVLLLGATAATALAADPTPVPGSGNGMAVGRVGGAGGAGMAGGMLGRFQGSLSPIDAVAKLLGLSVTEIETQREAGKSLLQVAQSKGVEKDALTKSMLADRDSKLDQLVQDGKLGQEQADYMLERMETQVAAAVERTTTGPMNSGRTDRGPGMGWRSQSTDQNPAAGSGTRMGGRFGAGLGAGSNR